MDKNLDEYYDAFPILYMYNGKHAVCYGMKKTTIKESGQVIENWIAYTPFEQNGLALTVTGNTST